jgi:hypothetical protein
MERSKWPRRSTLSVCSNNLSSYSRPSSAVPRVALLSFHTPPLSPSAFFPFKIVQRGRFPLRHQPSTACTESRSGENGSWAGGAPTKTPLRESGSRSSPGWLPILSEAAATSSRSCSAAPPDAINHHKSARFSAACARSEPTSWKPLRSSGEQK